MAGDEDHVLAVHEIFTVAVAVTVTVPDSLSITSHLLFFASTRVIAITLTIRLSIIPHLLFFASITVFMGSEGAIHERDGELDRGSDGEFGGLAVWTLQWTTGTALLLFSLIVQISPLDISVLTSHPHRPLPSVPLSAMSSSNPHSTTFTTA